MKDDPLIEIVDRLARIETKLDNHEQLREKADIALSMAKNNEEDIKEIKENQKW
ncbi:TPA: holin, partial [Enterococcus faecalis]|nr:holin [Enterococcus faecalis]